MCAALMDDLDETAVAVGLRVGRQIVIVKGWRYFFDGRLNSSVNIVRVCSNRSFFKIAFLFKKMYLRNTYAPCMVTMMSNLKMAILSIKLFLGPKFGPSPN